MRTHSWPRVDWYIVWLALGGSQSRRLYVCTAAVEMSSEETGQTQAEAILTQMSGFMAGLREFKAEIAVQQDELVRLTAKRSRQDRPYAFRRTGNAAQYSFVEEVIEHVREASWQLEKVDGPKVEEAAKELKEAEALLTRRMRIIKIADRSDHGWNMIAEYENDQLAIDSDDEKRLVRAEKEAERKAARKKPKLPVPAAAGEVVPPVRRFGAAPPVPAKIGPCFGCGEFGHLRRYCSKPAAPTSSASVV